VLLFALFPVCGGLLFIGKEFPRTSRCLSSGSSSLSSPSLSNASASVGSTVSFRSRDTNDDAREWKDGGGELGVWFVGLVGVSGSSLSRLFT
jgi:hypothetical protein